jgi:hypothetical protein
VLHLKEIETSVSSSRENKAHRRTGQAREERGLLLLVKKGADRHRFRVPLPKLWEMFVMTLELGHGARQSTALTYADLTLLHARIHFVVT